ncbi:unnamed protein product [Ixodes hexagonus]
MLNVELQSRVAQNVFRRLSEASDWWDVDTKLCEKCGLRYIEGKAAENSDPALLLPLPVDVALNFEQIQKLLKCLPSKEKVAIALQDGDSSVVFYDVMPGIVRSPEFIAPANPESQG